MSKKRGFDAVIEANRRANAELKAMLGPSETVSEEVAEVRVKLPEKYHLFMRTLLIKLDCTLKDLYCTEGQVVLKFELPLDRGK